MTHSVDRYSGGVGSVVRAAADAFLNSSDYEVIVVCVNRKRRLCEDFYGFLRALYITLKYRPDVIHQHGIWNFSSLVSRIASLFSRSKLVIFPHGMLAQGSLARDSKLKNIFWKFVEYPNISNGTLIWSAKEEQCNSIIPQHNSYVVYNPVPNEFAEKKIKKSNSLDTFLFLGRLDPKKNILEIINEFKNLSAEKDLRLVIAGDGDSAYTDALRTASKDDDRISFTGYVSGEKKAQLLERADFCLFNSEHEGLQVTLVECCYFYCVPIVNSASNASFLTKLKGTIETGRYITDTDLLYAHNLTVEERHKISSIANSECKRLFLPETYVDNFMNNIKL